MMVTHPASNCIDIRLLGGQTMLKEFLLAVHQGLMIIWKHCIVDQYHFLAILLIPSIKVNLPANTNTDCYAVFFANNLKLLAKSDTVL